MRTLIIGLSALLVFGSCTSLEEERAGSLDPGQADFRRLVILGDSFGAGIQSNGLVERNQRSAFTALFARQAAAADFEIPAVAEPGVPKLLALLSLSPPTIGVPPPADNPQEYPSRFINRDLPRPYNNLSVPGCRVEQALTRNFFSGNPAQDPFFLYAPLILRPQGPVGVSAAEQARSLDPTFVLVALGINDIGAGVFRGMPELITPYEEFEEDYARTLNIVLGGPPDPDLSGAVLVNIPSPTAYPFMTTIPWFVTTPDGEPVRNLAGELIPLVGIVDGQPRPLPAGSLVTLSALSLLRQGTGLPPGIPGANGQPLPDAVVLDNAPGGELSQSLAAVERMNGFIRRMADQRHCAHVDLNALLLETAGAGHPVAGVDFSAEFVTGGFFSLDGIHPSSLGHAFAANALIDVVNERYGANIPWVNVNEFLGVEHSGGDPEAAGEVTPLELAHGVSADAAATALWFFPAVGAPR